MIKVLDEDIVFNELQATCKGNPQVQAACPACPVDGAQKCDWTCVPIPGGNWPTYAGGNCLSNCTSPNTDCLNGTPGNIYLQCQGGCEKPQNLNCNGDFKTDCKNYQAIQPQQ